MPYAISQGIPKEQPARRLLRDSSAAGLGLQNLNQTRRAQTGLPGDRICDDLPSCLLASVLPEATKHHVPACDLHEEKQADTLLQGVS